MDTLGKKSKFFAGEIGNGKELGTQNLENVRRQDAEQNGTMVLTEFFLH